MGDLKASAIGALGPGMLGDLKVSEIGDLKLGMLGDLKLGAIRAFKIGYDRKKGETALHFRAWRGA